MGGELDQCPNCDAPAADAWVRCPLCGADLDRDDNDQGQELVADGGEELPELIDWPYNAVVHGADVDRDCLALTGSGKPCSYNAYASNDLPVCNTHADVDDPELVIGAHQWARITDDDTTIAVCVNCEQVWRGGTPALAVDCPECGVDAGDRCRDETSRHAAPLPPHPQRRRHAMGVVDDYERCPAGPGRDVDEDQETLVADGGRDLNYHVRIDAPDHPIQFIKLVEMLGEGDMAIWNRRSEPVTVEEIVLEEGAPEGPRRFRKRFICENKERSNGARYRLTFEQGRDASETAAPIGSIPTTCHVQRHIGPEGNEDGWGPVADVNILANVTPVQSIEADDEGDKPEIVTDGGPEEGSDDAPVRTLDALDLHTTVQSNGVSLHMDGDRDADLWIQGPVEGGEVHGGQVYRLTLTGCQKGVQTEAGCFVAADELEQQLQLDAEDLPLTDGGLDDDELDDADDVGVPDGEGKDLGDAFAGASDARAARRALLEAVDEHEDETENGAPAGVAIDTALELSGAHVGHVLRQCNLLLDQGDLYAPSDSTLRRTLTDGGREATDHEIAQEIATECGRGVIAEDLQVGGAAVTYNGPGPANGGER